MADSLEAVIREAVQRDGLRELIVRVSRYADDCKQPLAWQAIAKYHGRETGPWGVGILTTPEAAIRRALSALTAEPSDTPDGGDIFG